MSDYIGLKLGNYHIERLIARGGFAHVYQGEHIYLKTPAAIKVLNMQLIDDTLEKFLREARIIASLEHPHIVRVLEFGVEGITPFLVMNYANNGTLRQRYPRKSILSWSQIISYVKQVADALQYAHDHGVIHRDVKPENMLLDKNLRVQLSDFGLAIIDQSLNATTPSSAGTTAYMAPEQLQGLPGRASDQYALGIVVYEWLCGAVPFGGSEREMILQHLYKAPAPLHSKIPDISPAIEQIVMKALEKDPLARFATIQEFALALEQASAFETLLDIRKEGTAGSSADEQDAPFKNPIMDMPSSSDILPHLPLMLYQSTLTNTGHLLQPSLGSSIYSMEEAELSVTSFSDDDTSHTSTTSSPSTTPQRLSDPATPAFPYAATGAEEKTVTPLSLSQIQSSTTGRRYTRRVAMVGVAVVGLIILASMFLWTQFAPNISKAPLAQATLLPTPVPTMGNPTPLHKPGSTPTSRSSNGKGATITAQPGTLPGITPIAGAHPTPMPTTGAQPTPVLQPTSVPTPGITPTASIPLTIAFVNPPATAAAGSTITIVTQASQGGVTIVLRGKVRLFGQVTANSQGIASFQVKVPLLVKRLVLTATATDGNGNEAQASQTIIVG